MVTNPATRDWTVTASVVRHAQRDVRQPHGVRDRPRRLGGARHQRQADDARDAARGDPRHPRARQRPQRRVQGLDDHASRGRRRAALEVWVAGYGPKALAADRRGRRRVHPAARRPARSPSGRSARSARPPSRPGAIPTTSRSASRRRRTSADDVGPRARPVPLVRRDGRQPRRRHRRPLRRRRRRCPQALTDYIKGREGYDYNEHGQAGNIHTAVRARRDRRPLLHPRPGRRARPAAAGAARRWASTSSPIYLQHDDKDDTLQAYGEQVIPAIAEHGRRAKTVTGRASRRSWMFVARRWSLVAARRGSSTRRRAGGRRRASSAGRSCPRANDTAMPHVWEMLSRSRDPESRGVDRPIWLGRARRRVVLVPARARRLRARRRRRRRRWPSLMARFRVVERGLLPYLVDLADRAADRPRAARRQLGRQAAHRRAGSGRGGCRSPCSARSSRSSRSPSARCAGCSRRRPPSLELMRQLRRVVAARRCVKLRFPAAVPYMVPALKLAATGVGDRRRRRRDLDRPARRRRPADHRVRPRRRRATRRRCTRRCSARRCSAWRWPGWSRSSTLVADAQPTDGGAMRRAGVSAVEVARRRRRSSTPARPNAGRRARRHRPRRSSPASSSRLIGPSGCGKSTLLRLIANLIEPTTRRRSASTASRRAQARLDQDYGMAFQQAGLFEWRTVVKNIELPLELKGWDKADGADAGDGDARTRQARASSPSTCRGSCRAACSSGSRSPGRWPPTRRCC